MSTPTTDPDAAMAPTQPAPTGLLRATAIAATVGVVVALVGLGLLLRPVETPTQDCGTSLTFLLEGRVDEFVSETDPPAGISAAEAKDNNTQPCRERVADQTAPAAVLLVAGMGSAVLAAIIEMTVRGIAWWRRRTARRQLLPPPPAAV